MATGHILERQPARVISRRATLRAGVLALGGAVLTACGQAAAPTATTAPAVQPTTVPTVLATAIQAEPTAMAEPTATTAAQATAVSAEPTATTAMAEPTATTAAATEATEVPTQAAATGEKVELTLFTPYGTWAEAEIMRVMENYSKLNPAVTFAPPGWGGEGQSSYLETLLAQIAAGTPPDVTILWDSPVSLGIRGALSQLDDRMKTSKYSGSESWPEGTMSGSIWKSKTFGFPTFNAVYCMYYNQDAFKEKGIATERDSFPTTWDEWRQLSKQFTQWEGEDLKVAGYFPVWHDDVYGAFFQMWTELNGGSLYDAGSGKYTIDADANIATAQYALDWLDDEYKGDYAAVKKTGCDFGSDSQPEPCFQRGQVIMRKGGNFSVGWYKGENPPKFAWEIAKFPVGSGGDKPVAAFWPNWTALPLGGKNEEAAFTFLDWFNGEGVLFWSMTQPDLPANKNISRDFLPQIVVENRGEEYAKDFQNFFFGQLDVAARIWDSPITTFHGDQLVKAFDRVLLKDASPKDAFAEAQQASQGELERVLASQS